MTERRGRIDFLNGSYGTFPIPAGEKAELSVEELLLIARWPALREMRRGREDAEPVEPVQRTRQRKPSLASAIRQMTRAGLSIAGCEVNPREGTFKVITGKPVDASDIEMDDTTSPTDRSEWH